MEADVRDIVLRDGTGLTVSVGGSVTTAPSLIRDMEASSVLEVPLFDPTLAILEKTILSQKFDAHIDGLRFRYIGATKSGPTVTLNFEDEVVARLRELKGPKRAFRAKQTRANFICGLVEELEPEVPIYCPQRHETQPVEAKPKSDREEKKKAEEAKKLGGKGIGDHKGLRIKGQKPSPEQAELAEMGLRIAEEGGAPFKVMVALIAALIDETDMGAVARDNVLEGEGSGEGAPIGTAQEEISGFLFGKPQWTGVTAVGYYAEHPEATYYEIAQAVQKSGAGAGTKGAGNYGQFGDEARQWVEAFTGSSEGATSETITEPYVFQVGKKETYWGAIQRLAGEVDWRAFVVEGRFFFISEPELSRGQVQLAIEREPGKRHPQTLGIVEVDFEYDQHIAVNEATVTAMAEHWDVRPGGVVTLAGYGPASLGPGDGEPDEEAEIGLASGVKASTHEGKGRYLVSRIEVDLTGDPRAREVTVTLVKPTQPLPEKLPSTESKSTAAGKGALTSEGMPKGIQEAIEEAERINAKHYPYESPGMRGTPPPPNGPYDCSGVTSRLVYVACGAPKTTLASEELSHFGEPGEGEWMTIYAHGPNGPSGHALCRLKTKEGWKYFATSEENSGGGAGWVKDSYYGPGYFDAFSARHPKGF